MDSREDAADGFIFDEDWEISSLFGFYSLSQELVFILIPALNLIRDSKRISLNCRLVIFLDCLTKFNDFFEWFSQFFRLLEHKNRSFLLMRLVCIILQLRFLFIFLFFFPKKFIKSHVIPCFFVLFFIFLYFLVFSNCCLELLSLLFMYFYDWLLFIHLSRSFFFLTHFLQFILFFSLLLQHQGSIDFIYSSSCSE